MSTYRPIEDIFTVEKEHWVGNGFRVRNYFPGGRNLLQRFTPFALMDYNAPREFPPSESSKGIGPHPHRGIETVTFAFQGAVEHHDNAGNHGIIYPGDVQWMTAGKGIMHKEYHEKEFQTKGGVFQMIQLWVSLPKKDKYTDPMYQEITNSMMGKTYLPEKSGAATVVAGEFQGAKGPAHTFSPMNIYILDLNENCTISLDEPFDYNTGILMISGSAIVNGSPVKENDFILFQNNEGTIEIKSEDSTVKLIVLSGEPLNEPQVGSGPFVMNTMEEIRQASLDYREGKFGTDKF